MNKSEKAQELREALRILERKIGLLDKAEFSCCGATLSQCRAVVEIGRAKSISLTDLTELLTLDSSTISRTVNHLVDIELAEREIDPKDRRYVTIRLTESGRKIFERVEAAMLLYYKRICESIPGDKLDQVLESINLLIEAMNKNKCC